MPATASGMMKDRSPMLLSLRAQIVSAISKVAPNAYSLRDGASFTSLPCLSATVPPLVPTVSARPPFVAPWPERAAVLRKAESSRPSRRCRRTDRSNVPKALALGRASTVPQAHLLFPSHHWRTNLNGTPSHQQDNSLRRAWVPQRGRGLRVRRTRSPVLLPAGAGCRC